MAQLPSGGLIDPQLQQYMYQQRLMRWIQSVGQGFIKAGAGGAGLGPGLLMGLGNASAGGDGDELSRMLELQAALNKNQERQEDREKERRQDFAGQALTAGPRYDPDQDILWNQPPQPGREPRATASEEARALLAQASPDLYLKGVAGEMFPGPAKAPKTRNVNRGGETITEEWNPSSRRWTQIARGPRWAPSERGGLTVSQERTNAEVEQAREWLLSQGHSNEDILRIAQSQTDTGRDNPDYSPFINQQVRMATSRKYGPDPGYRASYNRFLGETRDAGPPSDVAGSKPLSPGEANRARVAEIEGMLGSPPVAPRSRPGRGGPGSVQRAPVAGRPSPGRPSSLSSAARPPLIGTGTEENPFRPQSQAEYNAVPSGATFIDPEDGQLYRKP